MRHIRIRMKEITLKICSFRVRFGGLSVACQFKNDNRLRMYNIREGEKTFER